MLHDYQRRAVEFVKDTANCALWIDPGLGKTITTLTALSDLFAEFEVNKVLIVAPLRVAQSVWRQEIERWPHVSHLKAVSLCGPAKVRMKAVHEDAQIYIINREQLAWLSDYWKENWPYDTVILDEASSFKSAKSQRFKSLRRVLPWINRLVELTATPASNSLLDLWPQIFLLDRGERLGKTMTAYKSRYFESDYMGYTYLLKKGARERIHEAVADLVLSMSAEDYLTLPKRVDRRIDVALTPSQRKQYRFLEKEFILRLEEEDVAVPNAAALTGKLLQFANGAVYTDADGTFETVHNHKIEALQDIVESANGAPVLVAYNFKSDLARLKAVFPKGRALDANPKTIDAWNAGEIPILFAHPASAGHGLNLQDGGHLLVWFGLNWSLELYEQFNARLDRQGQTKPVAVYHIVTENSVDETVLEALAGKRVSQQALLQAVKRKIETKDAA